MVQVVGAVVLLGNYVLKVETGRRGGEIRKMAILTSTFGPVTDNLAKRSEHQVSAERLRSARALACRIAMKSIACT
jgi:hypothetical protein